METMSNRDKMNNQWMPPNGMYAAHGQGRPIMLVPAGNGNQVRMISEQTSLINLMQNEITRVRKTFEMMSMARFLHSVIQLSLNENFWKL